MSLLQPESKQYREKGYLTDFMYSAVAARPVGQKEIRATPHAQKSLDVEWVKLESKPAWLYDQVEEWRTVSEKAKRSGKKAHVGSVFELCVEKGGELPKGNPLSITKVAPCSKAIR